MAFTFRTLFVSILVGSPLIYVQFLLMRRLNDKSLVSPRILKLISIVFICRMLLPFEFFYTITIPSKVVMTFIWDVLLIDLPFIKINLMTLLYCIWGLVSVYKLIKVIRDYRMLIQMLRLSPESSDFMINLPLQYQKYPIKVLPNVTTPCVVGLIKPTIILPNMIFTDKELEYILRHEYIHISKLDLFLKALYELLLIIYWWNPVMYVFREQFSRIIELRVDEEITESLPTEEKIEYIELMLKVKREQDKEAKQSEFAVYFASTYGKPCYQRSSNILNKKKIQQKLPTLLLIFILGFYLSTSVVFEPYYVDPPGTEGTIAITKKNSYLVKNSREGYDLYIDGNFIDTFRDISSVVFDGVQIYESLDKVK